MTRWKSTKFRISHFCVYSYWTEVDLHLGDGWVIKDGTLGEPTIAVLQKGDEKK